MLHNKSKVTVFDFMFIFSLSHIAAKQIFWIIKWFPRFDINTVLGNNILAFQAYPNQLHQNQLWICLEIMKKTRATKYLGVQFDWGLAFTEHVDRVVIQAETGMIAMKVMAVRNWAAPPLSRIPGSGPLCDWIRYGGTLSHKQMKILQRLKNEVKNIKLGCTKNRVKSDAAC